jgi:adenine-specific DNA-methyltransferase
MNMMYPRLFLARNLLREDGVIFISIDDHEVDNLRKLCNEVFGEENFVATLVWKRRVSSGLAEKRVSTDHEYVVAYTKNSFISLGNSKTFEKYSNPDSDPRGDWIADNLTVGMSKDLRPNQFYSLIDPKTDKAYPPNPNRVWAYIPESMNKLIAEGRIIFPEDTTRRPMLKRFKNELKTDVNPVSTWVTSVGLNTESTRELQDLFGQSPFDYSKPNSLLKHLTKTSLESNALILDFFAGSGTTAQAVLELNKEDGGNRKFILVQLPEPTGREDYKTIADITKERVRRVIQKISRGEEEGLTRRREDAKGEKQLELDAELLIPDLSAQKPDSKPLRGFAPSREPGFKVFKLDTSNFKTWDGVRPESPEAVVQQLELHVDHVLAGRAQEDILTELLLKSGFPLCTQVERMEFSREGAKDAKFYYSVEEGAMLICLEKDLTAQMVKELADKKPSRVICLDAGFQGSDQLKTNAVQTMKARGVLKFQTV